MLFSFRFQIDEKWDGCLTLLAVVSSDRYYIIQIHLRLRFRVVSGGNFKPKMLFN